MQSHIVLTLKLFFSFLQHKEWERKVNFTVQQLLVLVTVNRLLSEAVKVFYGPSKPSRLCRGSVRLHTLEESRATDGLAFRAAELQDFCHFPHILCPMPLVF